MSDGLVMSSTLYTLNNETLGFRNLAVQLQSFPYTREFEKFFAYVWTSDPLLKLQQGQGLLMQHTRGSAPGEGKFNGFHGISDIRDTVAWLKEQPWWSGVLFGTGYSAMGSLSYMSLLANVSFTAQSIAIAAGDEYHFVYQNGAFRKQLVNGMLEFVKQPQYNATYLTHEGPDDFWKETDIEGHYHQVKWPAVHTAGWYDVFLKDQLEDYEGYRTQADPSVRDLQFLIVNPSGHCFGGGSVVWPNRTVQALQVVGVLLQDLVFGILKGAGTPEKFKSRLELLRLLAKPIPRVFWYVLGPGIPGTQGNWISAADHLPQFQPTPFYLSAGRILSRYPFPSPRTERYVYDPRDPVRTWGGCNMGAPPGFGASFAVPCGPLDQLVVQRNRSDVLQFTSEPLDHILAITGPVTAVLHVSTDAPDTDFTAKLVDVFPNGTRLLVVDGIQRLRWRDLPQGPHLARLGDVYRIKVDLWSTSYLFAFGHRVGLDISSSNYPRFDANPNTGRPLAESSISDEPRPAVNVVHMGAAWDSHVQLPVVPGDSVRPFGPHLLDDALHHLLRSKEAATL